MTVQRICRACGCSEHRACVTDGMPCAWAGVDRCTACIDRPLTLPINAAHVRACRLRLKMHMRLGRGRHSYVHQAEDFPQIVITKQTDMGRVTARHLFVGAMEVPFGEWAAVAGILNNLQKDAA